MRQATTFSMPIIAVVGTFLLATMVYLGGSYVMLPGIDEDALASHLAAIPSSPAEQLSIIFLWVSPLFGALCLAESAKLICPPLARWQLAHQDNDYKLLIGIRILTLCLAAFQGYGVVTALSSIGLISGPEPLMRLLAIVGLMGGTALTIWVAERLRLPEGNLGIFIMLIVPVVTRLAGDASGYIGAIRQGRISMEECLVVIMIVAVAIAMIRAVYAELSAGPGKSIDILIWPPVLAEVATGYLLSAVILFSGAEALADVARMRIYALAITCTLIPLFAYGYFRRSTSQSGNAATSAHRKTFLKVIVAEVVIVLGCALIGIWLQPILLLNAQILITGVVIVLVAIRYGIKQGES